jgi:hypothetical protein
MSQDKILAPDLGLPVTPANNLGVIEPQLNSMTLTENALLTDSLDVGTIINGNLPVMHRAIELPKLENVAEGYDYTYVHKITGSIKYYELLEDGQIAESNPLGISCLVLDDTSTNEGRHGVLHSNHLGASCFISTKLEPDLALYVMERLRLRFTKKKPDAGRFGLHCLVIPTASMTLNTFVTKFSTKSNWDSCIMAANGEKADKSVNEEEPDMNLIDERLFNDANMLKLVRLLNTFSNSLSGTPRFLAERIKNEIPSHQNCSLESILELGENALFIYTFLYHLNETLDPSKYFSPLIVIENLMDLIDEMSNISEEWTIVNITKLVNEVF